MKSLLLSSFVLALSLGCAWAVVYFGRKAHQSELKLKSLAALFVVGGALLSFWAYTNDARQRRITLAEQVLEGSKGIEPGDDAPVRGLEFMVEHPDVEHTMHLRPLLALGEQAAGAVDIDILLTDSDEILLEESATFDAREEGLTRDSRTFSSHIVWEGDSFRFLPRRPGAHRLELTLLHVGIHEVFVRIEDPEKTDGVRAPGY